MAASSGSHVRQRTDRLESLTPRSARGDSLRLEERTGALRTQLEARADARVAGQLRADVKEARGLVREARDVSPATAERYQRTVQHLRENGTRPEDAACKASFEFQRAALVYTTRQELRQAMRDLDSSRRSGDAARAGDAYAKLKVGLETLRNYPPSTGNRAQDLTRTSRFNGPSRPPQDRSNGKRDSLSGLPAGWRDDIQREVRDYDRSPAAALSLAGCRPCEVRGIKVRQDKESDVVTLTIKGAKTDGERGIPSRTLSFAKSGLAETQAGRDLVDWLGNRTERTVSHRGSVPALEGRIARAADRAGHPDATAYSFRHAAAREMKEAGEDRDEIARKMGHRSDRSQSVYG